jgi:hypothetical protein
MKDKIFVAILTVALIASSAGVGHWLSLPAKNVPVEKENPFTKIGALATQNGMVAEVFSFKGCFVIVQTVPSEHARGLVQMVCP